MIAVGLDPVDRLPDGLLLFGSKLLISSNQAPCKLDRYSSASVSTARRRVSDARSSGDDEPRAARKRHSRPPVRPVTIRASKTTPGRGLSPPSCAAAAQPPRRCHHLPPGAGAPARLWAT